MNELDRDIEKTENEDVDTTKIMTENKMLKERIAVLEQQIRSLTTPKVVEVVANALDDLDADLVALGLIPPPKTVIKPTKKIPAHKKILITDEKLQNANTVILNSNDISVISSQI